MTMTKRKTSRLWQLMLLPPASFFCALLPSYVSVVAAPVYEVVRQEQAFSTAGQSRSLRQTVVVLDEAMVSGTPEANQRWTRIVVEAADAREASVGTLGARERLSVLVARRDGSELVPLFLGCSANMSAEEFDRQKATDTTFDRFLGRDAEARRKTMRDDFAGGLARALTQIQRRASEIAADPVRPGSLIRALHNAGSIADLSQGLPRFILISPFTIEAPPTDISSARQNGFRAAEQTGVEFGRAEVYLAGATLSDAGLEFLRAFVLGSKGILLGVRSDGVPRLQPEPVEVAVFAGFVDYVGQRVPLQLRFAMAAQGDLVNSWAETTLSRTTATPISGKALCKAGNKVCEVRGEGRFAQVWFSDPQAEPPDRTKLPFGGARYFEMVTDTAGAKGRVWDPKVVFVGEDQQRAPVKSEELRFEIERKEGLRF
jgi:hypothetical protein